MSIFITIDAGTSNTRVTLWRNFSPLVYASEAVGCRDTAITGSRSRLAEGVRKAVFTALSQAGIGEGAVAAVLASGMITSNMGLYELPHLDAPAGIDHLAQGMTAVTLPEIWPQPVWLIPGVKCTSQGTDWAGTAMMDMMRGEETEAIALLDRLKLTGPVWLALPGSHSKYIFIDPNQRIAYSITTLAGELYAAIAGHTILANSVGFNPMTNAAAEDLLAGKQLALNEGLGRACFAVRLGHLFSGKSETERNQFLLGAILAGDVAVMKKAVLNHAEAANAPFVIAGRKELRSAVAELLASEPEFQGRVSVVNESDIQDLAGYGALLLAARRGLAAR